MKRGFTLVELLLVVAIIGILSSIMLAALAQAQGQAKIYRTQTIITKINDALIEVYERYEYQSGSWKFEAPVACDPTKPNCLAHPRNQRFVQSRVNYLIKRDMMRMEMPQSLLELIKVDETVLEEEETDETFLKEKENEEFATVTGLVRLDNLWLNDIKCNFSGVSYGTLIEGTLSDAQTSRDNYIDALAQSTAKVGEITSAELLYLIIEQLNPEALAYFKGSEIGDHDGNGLFEFIDAWGNPIRFMRFAPGLQEGVIKTVAGSQTIETTRLGQPVMSVSDLTSWQTALKSGNSPPAMYEIAETFSDPLYPKRSQDNDQLMQIQWVTYPLVYSCGPDGKSGIKEAPNPTDLTGAVDDILPISFVNLMLGAPIDPLDKNSVPNPDYGCDRDNITNHNIIKPF